MVGTSERESGVPGAFPPRTWELVLLFLIVGRGNKSLSLAEMVFKVLGHDTSYPPALCSLWCFSKNCPCIYFFLFIQLLLVLNLLNICRPRLEGKVS